MKTNIIVRIISLLLIAMLTLTYIPALAEEELTPAVTFHWFERELYQAGFNDFNLEVKSEYLLDTRDYILVLRIETDARPFTKVINNGDLLGIKDGYILFAHEWAEEFMTEIRSWQPAN